LLRSVFAAIREPWRGADGPARTAVHNLPRYSDCARWDTGSDRGPFRSRPCVEQQTAQSTNWRTFGERGSRACPRAQLLNLADSHVHQLHFPRIDDGDIAPSKIRGVTGNDARIAAIGDRGDHEIGGRGWPSRSLAGGENVRIGDGRLAIEGEHASLK